MRRHLIHFLLVAVLSAFSAVASAQTTVKGQLVDAETGEPLVGAAVMVVGTAQGTVTDIDGYFKQDVAPNGTLLFKYVGYKDLQKKIAQKGGTVDLGAVQMYADAVALNDVIITSQAIARKTPVAMSTIAPSYIEERIGTADFPQILKSSPGVYVSRGGGGFGDSKVNIRGFKSENVAVLVNGAPMNDMEWGGVYWSNWAGLTDVSSNVQYQRGLGASKVSAPSVGGSINIVTKATDAKKGGFASYAVGNDGYNKVLFSVSSGLTKDGWAFTLLGGKSWGDGYVQGTEFEGYTYFASLAKRLGDNHQVSLTAFGAPQWHNQRSNYDGLTIEGWQQVQKYMQPGEQYRYNPTYGFGKNGERKTSARNKYHKPQIQFNHSWQIDSKSSLNSMLYMSIGDGYGYSGQGTSAYSSAWYGSSDGVLSTTFRNADGTFAYDKIQEMNEQSTSGSQMVMSTSKNLHKWYGLLSTYTKELNDQINFYIGIDARYYIGTHTNEIIDLYNGSYYIDRYRKNVKAANFAGAGTDAFNYKKLTVGDVVYRDYDGHVLQGGVFGQAEYDNDKLTAFVSGSISEVSQWRYDRFYYDEAHAKSDKVNKLGFTIKGGANYNLDEHNNVFANVGYISRAPYFSGGAFLSSTVSNAVNKDAVNEKVLSFEVGYGYRSRIFTANLNAYHTIWKDKTMARSFDYTDADGNLDRAMVNMQGVNSTHQGVELEMNYKPATWVNFTGMLSVGDWRWTNNPVGYFYNSGGQPMTKNFKVASGIGAEDHATMLVGQKNVMEGGSAQTTAAIGVNLFPMKGLRLSLDWNFYGRNYADYAVQSNDISLGGEKIYETPWRIPSYSTVDFSGSYAFEIAGLKTTLSGNIENLFNQEYINSAFDGGDHTWKTAYRVFYGFGRNMSLKLKVNF
ncbi:TonB-dependent receptor [Bacteroides heparinolyticus]|uniref:TonB-dependent receptor n=2 Tax=Prevotella heparinolytica TaxID=28113 RepID=A0A3P2A0M6_9BACE|nr:TonB-dependent receptor [Bacteroides heparinolyticus]MCF0256679.1 TonB-dependent receptor [Bacteroides heparinolyticus]MCI6211793.1 TonB-dependent receptor [Bacteroides heparinolyticus]RRD87183.1 TonB-dependent receptor [Bacteroides heparinolyticus]VFB15096.1 TonB-dependent receptor [Bacteroides heparinolyticus]